METRHLAPPSNPDVKLFQTKRVSIEDVQRLVSHSPCWKNFFDRTRGWGADTGRQQRPPLPLHAGHLSLMLASGVLDGVVGKNGDSHVVKGKVTKIATTTETQEINPETGETITIRRNLDQYGVTIKVLERTGTIRELT